MVSAAHSAEASAPKRTSLPSISAMSGRWWHECASDHTARPVEAIDISSMLPNTIAVELPAAADQRPTMKTTATGIRMIASVSSRLDNGVGFSSGTALLGPYQPPPLVPSCLIATIGATGPSGIFCSFISDAGVDRRGRPGRPAASNGTPCQVSSADHSRHSGSMKRSVDAGASTQ